MPSFHGVEYELTLTMRVTDAVTIHVCEIELFMEFRACIPGSSIIRL